MPIRVQCPNPECAKVMNVKDDMAGKRGKCPGCGGIIPIPAAQAAADNPFDFDGGAAAAPAPPAPEEKPAKVEKPAEQPPPEEEEDEVEEKPKPKKKKPVVVEDEEEEEDEDEDRPRKKKKKKKKKKKSDLASSVGMIATAMAIGIGLLLCLGVTTVLEWITEPPRAAGGFQVGYYPAQTLIESWEGKAILGFSITVSVLVAVAFGLSFVLERDAADDLIDASGAVAEAWAVAVAVWLMGFVWWSISLRFRIENAAQTYPDVEVKIFPYIGIFLGLLMALGVGLLFSYFVAARGRKGWILIAQVSGGLLGVVLALLLQPWDGR